MDLDSVLIRRHEAQTPHAYEGLAADAPWRVSGVWTASDGSRRSSKSWDDPGGDGNYCFGG